MFLILYLKSHSRDQCHLDFILYYLLGILYFCVLYLDWWSTLRFVRAKRPMSTFIFMQVDVLFFQRHCWRDCSFSIVSPLFLCQRWVNCSWGSVLWTLCSIDLSVLSPVPGCLKYCSFTVNVEVRKCQSFHPVLLPYFVACFGSFACQYKL